MTSKSVAKTAQQLGDYVIDSLKELGPLARVELAERLAEEAKVENGVWAWITPAGHEVQIDCLPMQTVEDIAIGSGQSSSMLARYPNTKAKAGYALYVACCELAGDTPVELDMDKITSGEWQSFSDRLQRVKSDTPMSWDGSGLPLEGATTTA